jgi:hypothetical protein
VREAQAATLSLETRTEIKRHLEPSAKLDKSYLRNAQLAKLEWVFITVPHLESVMPRDQDLLGKSSDSTTPLTVRAVVEFFMANSYVASVFGDLKPYLQLLSEEEQKTVLDSIWPIIGEQPHKASRLVSFRPLWWLNPCTFTKRFKSFKTC